MHVLKESIPVDHVLKESTPDLYLFYFYNSLPSEDNQKYEQ